MTPVCGCCVARGLGDCCVSESTSVLWTVYRSGGTYHILHRGHHYRRRSQARARRVLNIYLYVHNGTGKLGTRSYPGHVQVNRCGPLPRA